MRGSGSSRAARASTSGGTNRVLTLAVVRRLLLFGLAVRLVTVVVAFYANVVFPSAQRAPYTVMAQPHAFWDTFARYDSGWYRNVAQLGYSHWENHQSNLAFFPVYPLTMRAVARAFGDRPRHFYFAGIVVSWTAFFGALLAAYALARLDLDEEASQRAAVYMAAFPFAFFFGVVYSESTFLLLMLLAFYGFRTRRWWLAGLAGALAVCTRVNGIVALPAFAWVAWRSARPERRDRTGALAALVAVVAGFSVWCAAVYVMSGSPWEWKYSIERWGVSVGGPPWGPLPGLLADLVTRPYEYLTSGTTAPYDALNGMAAVLFAVSTPFVWWRLGAGYGLFMVANLVLPLSLGWFEGLGRYCSVLFPFFIWLASFRSVTVQQSVLVASAALYALCLAMFTTLRPLF